MMCFSNVFNTVVGNVICEIVTEVRLETINVKVKLYTIELNPDRFQKLKLEFASLEPNMS